MTYERAGGELPFQGNNIGIAVTELFLSELSKWKAMSSSKSGQSGKAKRWRGPAHWPPHTHTHSHTGSCTRTRARTHTHTAKRNALLNRCMLQGPSRLLLWGSFRLLLCVTLTRGSDKYLKWFEDVSIRMLHIRLHCIGSGSWQNPSHPHSQSGPDRAMSRST